MHAPVSALLGRRDASRMHVTETFGTAGAIHARIADGERPDAVIVPAGEADALIHEGLANADDRYPLGETEVGVAVRGDAIVFDVATPEALRLTILAARRIVIVDPAKGTSGGLMIALFQQLGVADAVRDKLLLIDGGYVMEAVARGDADLGFQQISEILPVRGVRLVGPLPPSLRRATRYDLVLLSGTTHRADLEALTGDLVSGEAQAVFARNGFTPPR